MDDERLEAARQTTELMKVYIANLPPVADRGNQVNLNTAWQNLFTLILQNLSPEAQKRP